MDASTPAWLRACCVVVAVGLSLACGRVSKPPCELPRADPAALRALLVAGRHAELEATLRGWQDAVERDIACEGRAWKAFDALTEEPRNYDRLREIDAFVVALPESFVPYAVRGAYFERLGTYLRWTRGGTTGSMTLEERIAAMRAAFDRAESDLLRAVALRPAQSFAFGNLMEIERGRGDHAGVQSAYDLGLAGLPRSHQLRERMLQAMHPRWGGSRREQVLVAFEAWSHSGDNPRMGFIVGSLFVSFASEQYRVRPRLAETLYGLALRFDDLPEWSEARGNLRWKRGDYRGAEADARDVLARYPGRKSAWRMLVGLLQERLDFKAAVAELDRMIEAFPDDAYLVVMRAYSHSKRQDFAAAEADYQRVLEIERSPRYLQAYSRFLVDEKHRDFGHAVELMREAVQIDPNDPENWAHLAGAQYMAEVPGMKESYERFVLLAEGSQDPEMKERVQSIREYLAAGALPRRGGRRPPPP